MFDKPLDSTWRFELTVSLFLPWHYPTVINTVYFRFGSFELCLLSKTWLPVEEFFSVYIGWKFYSLPSWNLTLNLCLSRVFGQLQNLQWRWYLGRNNLESSRDPEICLENIIFGICGISSFSILCNVDCPCFAPAGTVTSRFELM